MAKHKHYSPILGKQARARRISSIYGKGVIPDTDIDYEFL